MLMHLCVFWMCICAYLCVCVCSPDYYVCMYVSVCVHVNVCTHCA